MKHSQDMGKRERLERAAARSRNRRRLPSPSDAELAAFMRRAVEKIDQVPGQLSLFEEKR